MAGPAYVGAGSGVAVSSGNLDLSKASCTAGNLIVVQVYNTVSTSFYVNAATNVNTIEGVSNTLSLAGTFDVSAGPASQGVYLGRVVSTGTVTVQISTPSGTDGLMGRIYEFTGVAPDTNLLSIIENDNHSSDAFTQRNGSTSPINAPPVLTAGADRLALAFVVVGSNQALDSFTGESGGDWTEVVAEFASTTPAGAIGLQSAVMASAGSLSGGTDTITSAAWTAVGTALKPPGSASVSSGGPRMLTLGVG